MMKYLIMGVVAAIVILGAAASSPGSTYKNLKVLPRGISQAKLQRIMIDEFDDGLGVGCGFCHSEEKDSHRLDYASDAKPEKAIAREMMRMTLKVNHRFFQVRRPGIGDSTMIVNCNSCHHGQPRPEGVGE
jgi:hypothetical protein